MQMTTSPTRYFAAGVLLTGMFTNARPSQAQTLQYPSARKSDVVDDYHGTKVADPYRWLEDPDSPESRSWIEAENRLTNAYLADIPARGRIREGQEPLAHSGRPVPWRRALPAPLHSRLEPVDELQMLVLAQKPWRESRRPVRPVEGRRFESDRGLRQQIALSA